MAQPSNTTLPSGTLLPATGAPIMPVATITDPLIIVRLEIGDRDVANPLFTDAEIGYYVAKHPSNPLLAAADCCDALATRFAVGIDFTTDTLSVKKFQRAEMMATRAKELRMRAIGMQEDDQIKVDGFSQTISNTDTTLIDHENIDPDIPRYGEGWSDTLRRQYGSDYVPGS